MSHTFIHENLLRYFSTFHYDAHPMGIVVSYVPVYSIRFSSNLIPSLESALGSLPTFHPDSNPGLQGSDLYVNHAIRNKQIFRVLGKLPTIAACAYRHRIGRPYNYPSNGLGYVENFLYMMDRLSEPAYEPHPGIVRALEVLFIVHAEHELNCSTAALRQLCSMPEMDIYKAVAGAASALYGPSHGGANEAALRTLESIGTKDKIPAFIAEVKAKKKRLMGFGHRVYKSYDPRAKILKKVAHEVCFSTFASGT